MRISQDFAKLTNYNLIISSTRYRLRTVSYFHFIATASRSNGQSKWICGPDVKAVSLSKRVRSITPLRTRGMRERERERIFQWTRRVSLSLLQGRTRAHIVSLTPHRFRPYNIKYCVYVQGRRVSYMTSDVVLAPSSKDIIQSRDRISRYRGDCRWERLAPDLFIKGLWRESPRLG